MDRRFYVYVVKDGPTPIYVGKGTGGRLKASARKHGGEAEVIEWCKTECDAFERERYWIAELSPTNNKCPGGNGGRCKPKPMTKEERLARKEWREFEREINRVGSKRYCAQVLVRKLDEGNCEQWGVSKVDLNRLREVAHG